MAKVSVYLNFPRTTEEAFNFYKTVFGNEFEGDVNLMGQVPPQPGQPELSEEDKKLIMHVSLPIMGDFVLMGTDAPESMGFKVERGNNIYINLQPDTRSETERLFNALKEGGKVETQLGEMFWGDYYGALTDRFGIQWMLNCSSKE